MVLSRLAKDSLLHPLFEHRLAVRPSLLPFFRPHSGGTERPATVLPVICNRVVVTEDGFVTESSFPVTGL
jgi:hypothetical protein